MLALHAPQTQKSRPHNPQWQVQLVHDPWDLIKFLNSTIEYTQAQAVNIRSNHLSSYDLICFCNFEIYNHTLKFPVFVKSFYVMYVLWCDVDLNLNLNIYNLTEKMFLTYK